MSAVFVFDWSDVAIALFLVVGGIIWVALWIALRRSGKQARR